MSTSPQNPPRRRGRPRKNPVLLSLPPGAPMDAPTGAEADPSPASANGGQLSLPSLEGGEDAPPRPARMPSEVVLGTLPIIEITAQLVEALERGDDTARGYVEQLIVRYRELYGESGEASFRRTFEDVAKARRQKLPEVIPQQTSQEVRTLAVAISDGRSLARWEDVIGEIALRHVIPDEPFQIKFSPGAALFNWTRGQMVEETLREELRGCDLDTVLMLYETLGTAVAQVERGGSSYVTLSLDDLISSLGWDKAARRSGEERDRLRLKVWNWLLVFDSLRVIGQRPGYYRDPKTKELLELRSDDALIRIMGQRVSSEVRLPDGRALPLEVTFAPGPWIERHRGNRQILSDFGNVRVLARIPSGRAAGAWARCIGMTLLQRWREGASRVEMVKPPAGAARPHTGEAAPAALPLVKWPPFTRRALLTGLFRAQPDVVEILEGNDPNRAREYWDQAIALLQGEGFISVYRELKPVPASRQGWKEQWLDAPLEIMPGEEPLAAARNIMVSSRKNAASLKSGAPKKQGRPQKEWK